MKLTKDCIYWGKFKFYDPKVQAKHDLETKDKPTERYEFYIAWWNWLEPKYRYLGHDFFYYDCQVHEHFGLWFFNISWSTKKSWDRYNKRFPNEFT